MIMSHVCEIFQQTILFQFPVQREGTKVVKWFFKNFAKILFFLGVFLKIVQCQVSMFTLCSTLDRRLEAAGQPLAQLKDNGVTTYPCTSSCCDFWTRDMVCGHNMKFCHRCREHFTSTYTACPYHADGVDGKHGESSLVALTTHRSYNFIDDECDRECTYLHEKKISSYCRHSMARCKDCGNVWDGNAQCTCYLDDHPFTAFIDLTESDSDETNYGSDTTSQGFEIDTKLLLPPSN